jgi:hypothetical protein
MLKLGHSILLKVTTFQQKILEIIWCFHYKPTLIQNCIIVGASYAGDTRFETVLNQVLSMFSHSPLVTWQDVSLKQAMAASSHTLPNYKYLLPLCTDILEKLIATEVVNITMLRNAHFYCRVRKSHLPLTIEPCASWIHSTPSYPMYLSYPRCMLHAPSKRFDRQNNTWRRVQAMNPIFKYFYPSF